MLLNCGVGEDSWEAFGLQGDPTNPSWRKSVLNILWKDWCWTWSSNTLATWCEVTHWKRPRGWERLRAGGKGGNRGWDGWMASPAQWTWVWVNSGLMMDWEDWHAAIHGFARVGHDWGTELNWMLYQFKISPSAHTNSSCYLFSTNTLSFNPFWWFEQYFAVVFIYISLVIDEVEYLSIFLSVIWISSALKCLFKSFTYFSTILSFSC